MKLILSERLLFVLIYVRFITRFSHKNKRKKKKTRKQIIFLKHPSSKDIKHQQFDSFDEKQAKERYRNFIINNFNIRNMHFKYHVGVTISID